MEPHRPPSLNLSLSSLAGPVASSPSSAHRQSQSPFRYIQLESHATDFDEKSTPLTDLQRNSRPPTPGPSARPQTHFSTSPGSWSHNGQIHSPRPHRASPLAYKPSTFSRPPLPLLGPNRTRSQSSSTYTRPRGLRIANLIRPWIPIILYIIISLIFAVAIAFYRDELFSQLDQLAQWLKSDIYFGYAVLSLLIFATTFRDLAPLPLYSTLITLSGYTFGAWTGAVLSYFAALSGAITVFVLSRFFFRDAISRWLSCTLTIKRVVNAVEKRPKLLFLIRLAPYPYNVMNCLLAAAPTLTLRTYTLCTGLSLFKVIIHTSMGASIRSFKDYRVKEPNKEGEPKEFSAAEMWTVLGIVLCIAVLIYISVVARKAVNSELEHDEAGSLEEREGFLAGDLESGQAMVESPFRTPIR